MRRSIAVGACLVLCMSICYARVNPKEFPDALPVHEAAHTGDIAKLKEVRDQPCVSHVPPHIQQSHRNTAVLSPGSKLSQRQFLFVSSSRLTTISLFLCVSLDLYVASSL